jgi:protein-S-isoprenylcysteine O-methyltransferase Ste14
MKLFNAWLLTVPILIVGIYIAVRHRDTTKRMADMTGYSRKEKAVTVSASSAPHLFMLLAIFIPLSPSTPAVVIGAPLYAIGLIGFIAAVASYIKTPPETLAVHGIYVISRNPMYVAALMAYAGITILTLNILLAILLIIMIALHHMMILSEERACVKRFGKRYEQYRKVTPRYLFQWKNT